MHHQAASPVANKEKLQAFHILSLITEKRRMFSYLEPQTSVLSLLKRALSVSQPIESPREHSLPVRRPRVRSEIYVDDFYCMCLNIIRFLFFYRTILRSLMSPSLMVSRVFPRICRAEREKDVLSIISILLIMCQRNIFPEKCGKSRFCF